jgi:hypothetical protein
MRNREIQRRQRTPNHRQPARCRAHTARRGSRAGAQPPPRERPSVRSHRAAVEQPRRRAPRPAPLPATSASPSPTEAARATTTARGGEEAPPPPAPPGPCPATPSGGGEGRGGGRRGRRRVLGFAPPAARGSGQDEAVSWAARSLGLCVKSERVPSQLTRSIAVLRRAGAGGKPRLWWLGASPPAPVKWWSAGRRMDRFGGVGRPS